MTSPGTIVWFTGLPASGKTTTALAVIAALRNAERPFVQLDSDDLRPFFPGYDPESRDRFYAALAHIARRAAEGGATVIVSATANLRRYRDAARMTAPGRFIEVHMVCDPQVAEARDPKGLYAAARRGESTSLPGVAAVYEPPLTPEIALDATAGLTDNVMVVLETLMSSQPSANP